MSELKITKPNYKGNSIVNVMSSISNSMGVKALYSECKHISSKELASKENIVLIVFDGLGYNFIKNNAPNSFMNKHTLAKITTVCPSTTAAAITAFHTGVAPQQHAITGWFMYLKELGVIGTPLRHMPRYGGASFSDANLSPEELYYNKTLFDGLNRPAHVITQDIIADSAYNSFFSKNTNVKPYSTLNEMFSLLEKTLNKKGKKFIYVYWGEFDSLSHENGASGKKAISHFKQIDAKFAKLMKKIDLSKTIIMATADHGMVTVQDNDMILMRNHPKLYDTLSMPLSGERRFAYAYIKPNRVNDFKKYIKQNFSGKITAIKSTDLVKRNMFGLFTPNKKLHDRIGDYVLVAHEGYCIQDVLVGRKEKHDLGLHGGVSEDEMFVPLVVIRK